MVSLVKVKMLPMLPFPGACPFSTGTQNPIAFKTQINTALRIDEISDNIS